MALRSIAPLVMHWIAVPVIAAGLAAGRASRADPLPLFCDEDELGVSVELLFTDSSPALEAPDELRECNAAPIGTWNSLVFSDETDASTVQARGETRSEDGFVLAVENALDLDVDDDFFDFALVVLGVEAEAWFKAPPGDEPIEAEVIVEVLREGDLESTELSLSVVGEDVDLNEDLDDVGTGEHRFSVELEPEEEYRALLTVASRLDQTAAGSQTLRFRVETVPAPEAAAPLLLLAGGAVLATVGRAQRARAARNPGGWRRDAAGASVAPSCGAPVAFH
jgi:hypothetical protein